MNKLRWFSQYECLKRQIEHGGKVDYIFVPFIQLEALKYIIFQGSFTRDVLIVTRWNMEDLISGVSDIQIYSYLKDLDIKLYINQKLHMKLYAFDSGAVFSSSGNLTNAGMGIGQSGNHELGSFHKLTEYDYQIMNQIVEESTLVNDYLFKELEDYLKDEIQPFQVAESFPIYKATKQRFHKCPTPEYFIINYMKSNFENTNLVNDMYLFSIPQELNKEDLTNILKEKFCSNKLIKDIIEFIRVGTPLGLGPRPQYSGVQNGSIRQWLRGKYIDLERIEEGVNSLQDWLPFCQPEINVSVSIPGKHSRVFTWIE